MPDIREEFEEWALINHYTPHHKGVEGEYLCGATAIAWEAWLASRSALNVENEALRKAFDEANEMLARIGDFAHDKSTGPAVPDALWEIRGMAYSAVRIDFEAALKGGGK